MFHKERQISSESCCRANGMTGGVGVALAVADRIFIYLVSFFFVVFFFLTEMCLIIFFFDGKRIQSIN